MGGDSSLEHEGGNYFDLGSNHFITGVKVAKSFRRAIMSGWGPPQVATRWNSCRSILEIKVGLDQRSPELIPVCRCPLVNFYCWSVFPPIGSGHESGSRDSNKVGIFAGF